MKALLARENVELLAQIAFCRVLLAFDYDGTLAPIVADREAAFPRTQTSHLLQRVSELYPCAVVSGRTRRDLVRCLAPAQLEYVLGNHGIEFATATETLLKHVAGALPRLQMALAAVPGVEIEDKALSIAIHYRRSRRKVEARAAISRAAQSLPNRMRVIPGKLVINLVPAQAPNKGDAVIACRTRAKADTVLYIGDDVSDEDVFSLKQPGRLLCVRIGRSQDSSAPYYLRNQLEIDALLRTLIELRAGHAQPARPQRARRPQ